MIYQENVKITSKKRFTKDLTNEYSILNGGKYFSLDELQNYLVFISIIRIYSISKDDNDSKIEFWKSTGMSEESIKNPHISHVSVLPKFTGGY